MKVEPLDKPIGFVVPWYGDDAAGGAERLCREYVHQLVQAGIAVEVLTTCARDFFSNWNRNHYTAKVYENNGARVHRFPIRHRDTHQFDVVNFKLLNDLTLTAHEEHLFFYESIRSVELERFLAHEGRKYHLIFLPYCFGTTFEGLRQVDYRAFLLPCLHHERYAMLPGTRKMLESVRALIFNSESERQLAASLYPVERTPQVVLGMGVEDEPPVDPAVFRKRYGIANPYLICIGRKDVTKNTHVLVGYYAQYIENVPDSPLDLVLIGKGDVEIPRAVGHRIHNIGYVSDKLKRSALAGADLLVQPSARESFSIVLFEGWLAGIPALINEFCSVGVEHCRSSNGGLFFRSYAEFEEIVRVLTTDKELARQLAANGRRHALDNYRWERLIQGLVEFIRENGSF
jgi:glycosyltransferase involved in cell wall biosynthesis